MVTAGNGVFRAIRDDPRTLIPVRNARTAPALLLALGLALTGCLSLPDDTASDDTTATTADVTTGDNVSDALADDGQEAAPGTAEPVDTAPGVTTRTPDTDDCPDLTTAEPTLDTPIPDAVARRLIGMDESVAESCAAAERWAFRVTARDGEYFLVTADYRADRVNVTIEAGTVTSVDVG